MADYQKPTDEVIERRYGYRHMTTEQLECYYAIRRGVGQLARLVVTNTPCCPEQTRALNALDEVMALSLFAIERQ